MVGVVAPAEGQLSSLKKLYHKKMMLRRGASVASVVQPSSFPFDLSNTLCPTLSVGQNKLEKKQKAHNYNACVSFITLVTSDVTNLVNTFLCG